MCVITEHQYSCCNSYQIVKEPCPEAENCRWVHNAGRLHHDQCDGCRLLAGFWADFPQPSISDIPTAGALLPQANLAGLENFGDFAIDFLAPPTPPAEHGKSTDQHNDQELQRSHERGFEGTIVDTKPMIKAPDPAQSVRGNSTQLSIVRQSGPYNPQRHDSFLLKDAEDPFQSAPPAEGTLPPTDDNEILRAGSNTARGHTQRPPSPPESVRHLRATSPRMGAHTVEKPKGKEESPNFRDVSGQCLRPKPKPKPKPAKRCLDGGGQ